MSETPKCPYCGDRMEIREMDVGNGRKNDENA